jgi:hypothetical protein
MHKKRIAPKEFQPELDIVDASIVLLHAPETINKADLGIDTIDLIRKTINEWIEKEQ